MKKTLCIGLIFTVVKKRKGRSPYCASKKTVSDRILKLGFFPHSAGTKTMPKLRACCVLYRQIQTLPDLNAVD